MKKMTEEELQNFSTLWLNMLADPGHNEFFGKISDQQKYEFLRNLKNVRTNTSSNILHPIKNFRTNLTTFSPKPITTQSSRLLNETAKGIKMPLPDINGLISSSLLMSQWVAKNKVGVFAVTTVVTTVVAYNTSSDFRDFLSNLKLNSFNKFNKFFKGNHKKK
jgi:hypothetical protein